MCSGQYVNKNYLKALLLLLLKSLQSGPTLCNPIDGSPPGSPVPGILQARTLEWVAISFSNAWNWKVKSLSHVRLLATPRTAAHQAPPSIGFSRQEYWSGVPLIYSTAPLLGQLGGYLCCYTRCTPTSPLDVPRPPGNLAKGTWARTGVGQMGLIASTTAPRPPSVETQQFAGQWDFSRWAV